MRYDIITAKGGWVGFTDKESDALDMLVLFPGSVIVSSAKDRSIPKARGFTVLPVSLGSVFASP